MNANKENKSVNEMVKGIHDKPNNKEAKGWKNEQGQGGKYRKG